MSPREIANRYPRSLGYLIVVVTIELVILILQAVGVL